MLPQQLPPLPTLPIMPRWPQAPDVEEKIHFVVALVESRDPIKSPTPTNIV